MSLLTSIVAAMVAQPEEPKPSVRKKSLSFGDVLSHMYRGIGTTHAPTASVSEILEAGELNWRPIKMPLLIQGKHENRPFSGHFAIVRSDSGDPLSAATESYEPVPNEHLIAQFQDLAHGLGGHIAHTYSIDNGANIVATVELAEQFDVRAAGFGDKQIKTVMRDISHGVQSTDPVHLAVRLTASHIPGTAITCSMHAVRLICGNGAIAQVFRSLGRVVHKGKAREKYTTVMQAIKETLEVQWEAYQNDARTLASIPASPALARVYAAELYSPEAQEIRRKTLAARPASPETSRYILEQIVTGMTTKDISLSNTAEKVVNAVHSQPGAPIEGQETMWDLLNAVTWYTQHMAGKGGSPERAVKNAYTGSGQGTQELAYELAMEYARLA